MEYNLKKSTIESLCCTPETNTILEINYTFFLKVEKMCLIGEDRPLFTTLDSVVRPNMFSEIEEAKQREGKSQVKRDQEGVKDNN